MFQRHYGIPPASGIKVQRDIHVAVLAIIFVPADKSIDARYRPWMCYDRRLAVSRLVSKTGSASQPRHFSITFSNRPWPEKENSWLVVNRRGSIDDSIRLRVIGAYSSFANRLRGSAATVQLIVSAVVEFSMMAMGGEADFIGARCLSIVRSDHWSTVRGDR